MARLAERPPHREAPDRDRLASQGLQALLDLEKLAQNRTSTDRCARPGLIGIPSRFPRTQVGVRAQLPRTPRLKKNLAHQIGGVCARVRRACERRKETPSGFHSRRSVRPFSWPSGRTPRSSSFPCSHVSAFACYRNRAATTSGPRPCSKTEEPAR